VTARRVPVRCGTQAGYQRHRRRAEKTCDSCRKAHREYGAIRRAKARKGKLQAEAWLRKTYELAVADLIALHAAQFEVLLDEKRSV
jgi:hypothetical protein